MAATELISMAEARRRLWAALPPLGRETVSIAQACGRLLAAPVTAAEDLPRFDRAAMDGYAVRACDVAGAGASAPVRLALATPIAAGDGDVILPPGTAIAVATGARVPAGADAVVMVEQTRRDGETVLVAAELAPGRNVARCGDDVRKGDIVLPAGRRVSPRDLLLLGSVGVTAVAAMARPRVAILSSGAELVDAMAPPKATQIRDVNQPGLAAAARELSALVTLAGIVPDDPALLAERVRQLAVENDFVLISGGTSVGTADHTAAALRRLGADMLFHGLAVRPGRPTLAATFAQKLVIGLPGVPAAAAVIFHVFVRPLLRHLNNRHEVARNDEAWLFTARLGTAVASAAGREDFVRVTIERRGQEVWAHPVPGGASSLLALATADGVALVPSDRDALAAGDSVDVLLF